MINLLLALAIVWLAVGFTVYCIMSAEGMLQRRGPILRTLILFGLGPLSWVLALFCLLVLPPLKRLWKAIDSYDQKLLRQHREKNSAANRLSMAEVRGEKRTKYRIFKKLYQ